MVILGVDPGQRRVGLAISDDEASLAFPLETVERTSLLAVLSRIAAITEEREVRHIVVGFPLRLDGTRGGAARRAEAFAKQVAERTGLEVELWDERFTTASAEESLRRGGVPGRRRRELVDQAAAALILQSYLDARSERSQNVGPADQ